MVRLTTFEHIPLIPGWRIWRLDTIEDGFIAFRQREHEIRLRGDFTIADGEIVGAVDVMRFMSDGVKQYKVEDTNRGFLFNTEEANAYFNELFSPFGRNEQFLFRGNDRIIGSDQNDAVTGWDGDDIIRGGAGRDVISGGDGSNTLYGGIGPDSLISFEGDNLMYGGKGHDDLSAYGRGADTMYGGGGRDVIISEGGEDRLYGGRGDDVFQLSFSNINPGPNTGDTTKIKDFGRGDDRLVFEVWEYPIDYDVWDFLDDFFYRKNGHTFFQDQGGGDKIKLTWFKATKAEIEELITFHSFYEGYEW